MKHVIKTKYWHKLDDGRVQCDLCPRFCKLKEGNKGLCFVRECQCGEVVMTSYGRSTGFQVDPIEKKPLNHILPGTKVFSFGTAGCNLSCVFCQNWHMSRSRQTDLMASVAMPAEIAGAAKKQGCKSVAFTYNDPVIFMEYAVDTAKECHKIGIKTVAVTAGVICEEPRKGFFKHIDAANVDLKAFSEEFYQKNCSGDFQTVLDTLIYLKKETNVWVEITTLLIPGENDSDNELDKMTKWIFSELGPDVPLHFSAFHPDFKMLDKPRTPTATLIKARDIAIKNGLHYVYTGNVSDKESQSTYCHKCQKTLIGRDWYSLSDYNLEGNKCKFCGAECAGVF